jgi:hypothetical protein
MTMMTLTLSFRNINSTTYNDGYLGLSVEEERSKVR